MEINNSLSKTLKDHSVDSTTARSHLCYAQLCSSESPWNPYGINQTLGISWPPPRSYSCTFCRREFRSAQALGGHMNVHRRDRARLRQSSPVEDFRQYQVLSISPNRSPSRSPGPNPRDASSTSPLLLTTNCSIAHSFASPTLLSLFSSASDCRNEVKAAVQSQQGALRSRTMESKSKPRSEASARVQEMRSERYKCSDNNGKMDLLSGSSIDLELRLGCP